MSSKILGTKIPDDVAYLFKNPPLVSGESRVEYELFLQGHVDMYDPQNLRQWLLLRTVVDLNWEERRYVKTKAAIINMTVKEAVRLILESIVPGNSAERALAAQKYAEDWFKGGEERLRVLQLMEPYGLSEDSVMAQATTLRLPEIEKLEHLLHRVRSDQRAAARELELLRANGILLRKEIAQIATEEIDAIAAQPLKPGLARIEPHAMSQSGGAKPQ